MQPVVGKYLGACLIGINDRNSTIRKHYANTIGNLIGIAKPQSVENLFVKLEKAYFQNPSNKGIPSTIREINNRNSELLKDYFENVLPLIFFAIHEIKNDENKAIVQSWESLWDDITPGDAGISANLNTILELIKKNVDSDSWNLRIQSGAAINKIFNRLNHIITKDLRLSLINIILNSIRKRVYKYKEVFLTALVGACHSIRSDDDISSTIIETVFQECKKSNMQYKTKAIESFGLIVEELDVNVWEQFYEFSNTVFSENDSSESTAQERIDKAKTFNNLKEAVCLALGRCWPKKCLVTQNKFQIQFVDECSKCILESTRQVQIACLFALSKFVENLCIFNETYDLAHAVKNENMDKKYKIDTIETLTKISSKVLDTLNKIACINHTGIKQESAKILKLWIQRCSEKHISILEHFKPQAREIIISLQSDPAPNLQYNVQQVEKLINEMS